MSGVMCPHCGASMNGKRRRILAAVKERSPIHAQEIARLIYSGPYAESECANRSVIVQINRLNKPVKIIESDGRGRYAKGYRYIGP